MFNFKTIALAALVALPSVASADVRLAQNNVPCGAGLSASGFSVIGGTVTHFADARYEGVCTADVNIVPADLDIHNLPDVEAYLAEIGVEYDRVQFKTRSTRREEVLVGGVVTTVSTKPRIDRSGWERFQ